MEALDPREDESHGGTGKYPDELRERAIRMAVDARRDPAPRSGALRRIGEQLGIDPETLRTWVTQAEIDEGRRPGTTTDDATRLAELERENRELRRIGTDEGRCGMGRPPLPVSTFGRIGFLLLSSGKVQARARLP